MYPSRAPWPRPTSRFEAHASSERIIFGRWINKHRSLNAKSQGTASLITDTPANEEKKTPNRARRTGKWVLDRGAFLITIGASTHASSAWTAVWKDDVDGNMDISWRRHERSLRTADPPAAGLDHPRRHIYHVNDVLRPTAFHAVRAQGGSQTTRQLGDIRRRAGRCGREQELDDEAKGWCRRFDCGMAIISRPSRRFAKFFFLPFALKEGAQITLVGIEAVKTSEKILVEVNQSTPRNLRHPLSRGDFKNTFAVDERKMRSIFVKDHDKPSRRRS